MDDKKVVKIARQDARGTLLNLFHSCGLKKDDEWKIDLFIEQIIAAAIIETAIVQKEAIERALSK